MKARILILALTVSVGVAHAQYFQKTYSRTTTSVDNGRKGINAIVNGQSVHLQTGSTATANGKVLTVTSTNAIGIQNFCNSYQLATNWAGSTVSAVGQAINYNTVTNEIVVVGDFTTTTPVRNGIFVIRLTSTGAVVPGSVQYFLQPTNTKKLYVSAVRVVNNGNQILACGSAESATIPNSFDPWVFRYNPAFNVGWFRVYDEVTHNTHWSSFSNDLVESTFNGIAEIAVVGQSFSPNSEQQGFLMRLDVNGNMSSFSTYDSGVPSADDRFTAITKCNSASGAGYVIAGFTNTIGNAANANYRAWVMRTDNTGNTIYWSNTYNYLGGGDSYIYGIVERAITGGVEYFVSGHAVQGLLGGSDAIVIRISDAGISGVNRAYSYGSSANEFGVSIDQGNGTLYPGITLYGQKEVAGNFDFYMVKAYYNGICSDPATLCKERLYEAAIFQNVPLVTNFTSTNTSISKSVAADPPLIGGVTSTICNYGSLPNGDNTRLIGGSGESPINEFAIHAFPNPVNASSELQVNVDVPEDNMVHLMLVDMLGKTIWSADQELVAGTTTINIPLPQLPAGLYNLSVANATETKSTLISVK